MMGPVTGIVLAGGQSRRMGRDKAGITLGGQTLLQRATGLLVDAGCDPVLVVGGENGLPDRFPGRGPLAGIDAALQSVPDGRILVMPVDMPRMTIETLQTLMQHVCAHIEGESLPCILPVQEGMQSHLQSVLDDDDADRSLMAFYRHMGAKVLPMYVRGQFLNCNRPEDLENIS